MFLLLLILVSGFVEREDISIGLRNGRVLVGDFDRDGAVDLIFSRDDLGNYVRNCLVMERVDSNSYVIRDTVRSWVTVWSGGDFDGDGLYDIVTDGDSFTGLMIFESSDSFSYPLSEVWRDTVDIGTVQPISV